MFEFTWSPNEFYRRMSRSSSTFSEFSLDLLFSLIFFFFLLFCQIFRAAFNVHQLIGIQLLAFGPDNRRITTSSKPFWIKREVVSLIFSKGSICLFHCSFKTFENPYLWTKTRDFQTVSHVLIQRDKNIVKSFRRIFRLSSLSLLKTRSDVLMGDWNVCL